MLSNMEHRYIYVSLTLTRKKKKKISMFNEFWRNLKPSIEY